MDWDAIGAIADIGSAVMVAVSLAYLAVQVRELRRHSQVERNRCIMENFDRVRSELWKNPEVPSFVDHCHATSEPLSSIDRLRFGAYPSQWIWTWVQLFENSPGEQWVRLRPGVGGVLQGRAAREYWEKTRGFVPPEFRREVDAILATQSEVPAPATPSG